MDPMINNQLRVDKIQFNRHHRIKSLKNLIENHPNAMNKVCSVMFKRFSMQLMLPLVDLSDGNHADEIKRRFNFDFFNKDSQVMDLMINNQLRVDKIQFNRHHRTYAYLMFIFKSLKNYKFILDTNEIYCHVENVDFSYLIKYIYDYMNRIYSGVFLNNKNNSQLLIEDYSNPFRNNHPFPLLEQNSVNYSIDKVIQKFILLITLYHDIGFYNQQQMDILWCYLIVCLDFFNKKSTNDLNFLQMTKHTLIFI